MENLWQALIGRQFAAAIQMLRQAIEACPDELWDDRTGGAPFWQLAHHALFFTDLYLSDDEESYEARIFDTDKTHLLPGDYGEYGGLVTTPATAFTKDRLLEYADYCLEKCEVVFATLTDEHALDRCGFSWYELNIGEFLLNNLRHTQHHAGQLTLLLRRHADVGIDWLGTKDNQPPPPTW